MFGYQGRLVLIAATRLSGGFFCTSIYFFFN